MAILGTQLTTEKLRGDLTTLIARSQQAERENQEMKEEMDTLRERNQELEKDSKKFDIFRPILENPPTHLAFVIRDKRVAMELEGRVRNMYKRRAGNDQSDDAEQRRLWRMNINTVALACVKRGLESWDTTFTRHLSPVAGTR